MDERGTPSESRQIAEEQKEYTKCLKNEMPEQGKDLDKDSRPWRYYGKTESRSPSENFKGFVDRSFDTLWDRFMNFPSNIALLRAGMQEERAAAAAEEEDIWRRWTGSYKSRDHMLMEVERRSLEVAEDALEETQWLLREAFKRNKSVPQDKIRALYADTDHKYGELDTFASPMLSFGGACYYRPETANNLPSTRSFGLWGDKPSDPRWLSVEWFKRSQYSPIRLEAHPDLGASDTKWRAAFEELLCATLDRPMKSEEKIGFRPLDGFRHSTYHGPGLDWMLSLQCRGILPPQLPNLMSMSHGMDWLRDFQTKDCSIFKAGSSEEAPKYSWDADLQSRFLEDIDELIGAVSIKTSPDVALPLQEAEQTPWSVPQTEQELYEQLGCGAGFQTKMPNRTSMEPFESRSVDAENCYEKEMTKIDNEDSDSVEMLKVLNRAIESFWSRNGGKDAEAERAAKGVQAGHAPEKDESALEKALKRVDLIMDVLVERGETPLDKARKRNESLTALALKELDLRLDGLRARSTQDCPVQSIADRAQVENKSSAKDVKAAASEMQGREADLSASSTKPDVLSQLTTTQTTRLPDGTVTTKVVLKKRFADGREETQESVSTVNKRSSIQQPQAKPSESLSKEQKKGWFWS